jgi:hypothetical protein
MRLSARSGRLGAPPLAREAGCGALRWPAVHLAANGVLTSLR